MPGKPTAYFRNTAFPSYQEHGEAVDTNGALTQKADVVTTAVYASSGAVAIVAGAGAFTNWPEEGYVYNVTKNEVMLYSSKTGATQLNIEDGDHRALDGTSASAGEIGDSVRFIEARCLGLVLNQLLAEVKAIDDFFIETKFVGSEVIQDDAVGSEHIQENLLVQIEKAVSPDNVTIEEASDVLQVKNLGITPDKTDFALSNFCLNPGLETVLPGTHTTTIRNLTGSATTKNTQFPGWKLVTQDAADNITIDEETSIVNGQSLKSAKITAAGVAGSPRISQHWTAAEYLSAFVAAFRGKRFNFAADVKLGTAQVNACRLFITTDGTSGTTTYGSYHGNNDSWERLFVSVLVPTDATYIYFGFQFENTGTFYYLDNCSVLPSTAALTELAYAPRLPINISGPFIDNSGADWYDTTPPDTNFHPSGGGVGSGVDYNFNTNRPAWANGIVAVIRCLSATAGRSAAFRPYGATTTIGYYTTNPAANQGLFDTGLRLLGQDGQLEAAVSNTDTDFYFYIRQWHGEGL